MTAWPGATDRRLVEVLRVLPDPLATPAERDLRRLLERAELHGLSGVVLDALDPSSLDDDFRFGVEAKRLARALDHEAHLALLHRIDAALAAEGLRAIVLKGPLLAERLYARPAARATSDVDILVRETDLEATTRLLDALGYRCTDAVARSATIRRDFHHFHFASNASLPLELHFRAYAGFGSVLGGAPLFERAVRVPSFAALSTLDPADELVFLAVHAAAHRFVRLGWLYDMKLLVATMPDAAIVDAAVRARETGYQRPLAFAARLLVELLGVDAARLAPIASATLDPVRLSLVRSIVGEPANPVLRSATRFVYTTALCDSPRAAARSARRSSVGYVRRVLGLDRHVS